MIYTHNKRQYAIGMEWSDCEDASAAKTHIKDHKQPYLKVAADPSGASKAVAVGLFEPSKARNLLSCSMAVGLVEPDVIIFHKLSDESVWIAVLHSGLPYSGMEHILPVEKAQELLREQMLYTSLVIGDMPGSKNLNDVLSQFESWASEGRLTKQQVASIQVLQPSSTTRLVLYAALVLSLAAAVTTGWWLYQRFLSDAATRKNALSKLSQTRAEQEKLEEERQRRIAQFNSQVAAKREEMSRGLAGPQATWQAWDNVRRKIPLTVNGYVPQVMECTLQKCTVTWGAQGPDVRMVDRAAIPNWIETLEPTLEAKSEYALPAIASMPRAMLQQDAARTRLHIAQMLQFAVEAAAVGPVATVTITPAPPPPETGLKAVTLGAIGDLRIVASGDTAVLKVTQAIAQLRDQPVALKAAHFTQLDAGTPAVDIEGYWVFVDKTGN